MFRLERMHEATLLPETFEVPAAFAIRDYLGRRPWDLGEHEAVRATVRFGFPDSRWVIAQGVGETVDDSHADGGATLAFDVREPDPFLRWLLTFGPRADLTGPPDLRAELEALRRRVAELYR